MTTTTTTTFAPTAMMWLIGTTTAGTTTVTTATVPGPWDATIPAEYVVRYGDVTAMTTRRLGTRDAARLGTATGQWTAVTIPAVVGRYRIWHDRGLPGTLMAGIALMVQDPTIDGDGLVAGLAALIRPRVQRELARDGGERRGRDLLGDVLAETELLIIDSGQYTVTSAAAIYDTVHAACLAD